MGCRLAIRQLTDISPEALTGIGLGGKSCAAEMREEATVIQWLRGLLFRKQNKPIVILGLPVLML